MLLISLSHIQNFINVSLYNFTEFFDTIMLLFLLVLLIKCKIQLIIFNIALVVYSKIYAFFFVIEDLRMLIFCVIRKNITRRSIEDLGGLFVTAKVEENCLAF
jgi:hypothetical protein